jgi:hypothetical protein
MSPSLVRSWFGLDDMYNAEDVRSVAYQPQAGLLNHPPWLTIPVTAKRSHLPVGQSILQPAEKPDTAAAMFEQQDAAFRLADAPHLTQYRQWIGEGAGAQR